MKATKKQKEYAKDIAYITGAELPERDSKAIYAMWLNEHVPHYKEVLRQMNLEHELEMESIDARRDW